MVQLTVQCVFITYFIVIKETKQKISELLAVEEEKRKVQLTSSKQDNDDLLDTMQGCYAIMMLLQYC